MENAFKTFKNVNSLEDLDGMFLDITCFDDVMRVIVKIMKRNLVEKERSDTDQSVMANCDS